MAGSDPIREQQKRDLAVEVLRASGQLRLAARGYSMLPSLWPGDVLTIRAVTLEQMQRGDLALFSRDGNFFIHRVLRREQVGDQMHVVTRGDSMPHEDLPVSPREVLGKVVAVERNGQALAQLPACTPLVRGLGLALAWGRLRSVVLRLRQQSADSNFEVASNGVVSL